MNTARALVLGLALLLPVASSQASSQASSHAVQSYRYPSGSKKNAPLERELSVKSKKLKYESWHRARPMKDFREYASFSRQHVNNNDYSSKKGLPRKTK